MRATRTRLRHQLGYSSAAVIGSTLISGLGGAVGARALGTGGKGAYALWVLVATGVGSLGTGGLEYWINRTVARAGGVDSQVRRIVRHHLRVVVCLAVALTVAAVAVEPILTGGLDSEALVSILFALSWVISMLGVAITSGMLRLRRMAAWMLLGGGVYLLWSLALWVAQVSSVSWFLAGAAVGNLIPAVSCVRLLQIGADQSSDAHETYRSALRFGLPGAIGDLITFAALRVDVLLVALWLGLPAAGIYAVASAVGEAALLLPNSVATALLPRAAAERDWSSRALMLCTAVAAAVAAAGLAATAWWTVPLVFGGAFRHAAPLVGWLAPAAAALGMARVMNADLTAHGRSGVRAAASIAAVAVMVSVDTIAIHRWGLSGAGLGALSGYGTSAGISLWFWLRQQRASELESRAAPVPGVSSLVVG
jgi:O-antigen/teichoic acid export membrane protein